MSLRIILAASAVLAFAAPAFAQDAPAAPPAASAEDTAAQAAFEAKGEAFGARMEAMGGEMQAAVTAANGDQARATAALDVIVAKYQPEADTFATELEAFITSQMANAPEEQRAQMVAMGPMISAQVKGAPAQMRDQALASMTAAAAAPAQ
ncbi:hypothetical protein GGQ87_001038 [Brevundimonas alba]|uniref:Translation initiation factor IF-2 n=1 Tax=Brevundimonas alba TaxID=74314 RepID=A0A7X5YLK1_9CAUL|nr:translation initiation factor IF-2 [Brevundimonas alba]NJC40780.1 hypothetical protein [Brevundimonas alba]